MPRKLPNTKEDRDKRNEKIRQLRTAGLTYRALSIRFQLSDEIIRRIVRGGESNW